MTDPSRESQRGPTGLPPRVVKKRRSAAPAAARHAAWVLPAIACVAFAVLIFGGLAVRRLVVHIRRPTAVQEVAIAPAASSPADPPAPPLQTPSGPASSEPEMEVLPPKAAREPGRTLAKMLIVGAGEGMFASLNDAIETAIRGDVIEIRGDGPFWLEQADLKFDPAPASRPLVIRAGDGFHPVIRVRFPPQRDAVVAVQHADVRLDGLHFSTGNTAPRWAYPELFGLTAGSLAAHRCSMTRTVASGGGNPVLVKLRGAESSAVLERCLFRGLSGARLTGPRTKLQCRHCVWLCDSISSIDISGHAGQQLEVARCTFFATTFLTCKTAESKEAREERPRLAFQQNVFVSPWCCAGIIHFVPEKARIYDLTREDGMALAEAAIPLVDAGDNLVRLWPGSAPLRFDIQSSAWPDAMLPLPFPLGPDVKPISFGPRLQAIIAQVFRRASGGNPGPPQFEARGVGVSDLLMNSDDPATAALLATGNYGADPRLLVDPPAQAAEAVVPLKELAE